MVDVFDEVEEELRRERYNKAFRQWAPWVIGGAVAIVAGVAGYQYWTYQSNASAEAAADAYFTASELFEGGDLEAASAAFSAMAGEEAAGYATLSYMRLGEIALAQNDTEEAARYFEQAAARAPEPLTRQLAQYKAALALFEALSYDDISVRMTPLTEGDALFGVLARELMAMAAMRDERWDEARGHYQLLSVALDAPEGVARRSREALVYIAQNTPQAVAEPVVDASTSTTAQPSDAPIDIEADAATDEAEGAEPDTESEEGDE